MKLVKCNTDITHIINVDDYLYWIGCSKDNKWENVNINVAYQEAELDNSGDCDCRVEVKAL